MAIKPATKKLVPIGIVLSIVGYAAIKGTDGLEKLLKLGDFLHGDDHVKTGPDAELVVGFADGTSLELGGNADALLDAEVFDISLLQTINSIPDALGALRQALLAGADPASIMQMAATAYATHSEGGSVTTHVDLDTAPSAATDTGRMQSPALESGNEPIRHGDGVASISGTDTMQPMPEMVLPRIGIADVVILEPTPGKGEEEGEEGGEGGHTTGDSGHTGGGETGHDTGSDTGHDTGSTGGHDSGGHDPGAGGGYSAGHGGGYGYAGGSLSSVAVFTVTLSAPYTHDVRVNFTTVDGTAISGGNGVSETDYGQNSGTLVIPAGQISGSIEITIYSDRLVESDEQFYVQLSNPVNAILDDATGLGTIIDSGHGEGDTGEGQMIVGTEGDDVIETRGGPDIIDGLGGNDTLIAGGGPDVIYGGAGDDFIVGLGGPDQLYGGEGNDEIIGHGGPDFIDGGEGDDIIYAGGAPDTVIGGPGNDFINAEGGPDTVDAGEGDDIVYGGGGPDLLQGGAGDDVIYGEGGPDTLDGGTGNDLLRGGGGADLLQGGPGNDDLAGGGGPDMLIGGEGTDILRGGEAGDIFRFENLDGSIDRIVDFDQHDQIDISSILDYQDGDPIANYVQITPSVTDPLTYDLSINATGTGDPADYQTIAVLENLQTAPDLDQLVSNGNLVIIE